MQLSEVYYECDVNLNSNNTLNFVPRWRKKGIVSFLLLLHQPLAGQFLSLKIFESFLTGQYGLFSMLYILYLVTTLKHIEQTVSSLDAALQSLDNDIKHSVPAN